MRLFLHDYGGYAFTAQLARALAGAGHQVNYAYSITTQSIQRFATLPVTENLTMSGVELERNFARHNFLRRWRGEREHGRLVAARLKAFRPDIVLSANSPLDAQAFIQRASRESGAKSIFWMQDAIGVAAKSALSSRLPLFGSLIGDYYIHLEQSLLKNSDAVIVIADDFCDYLVRGGVDPARIHVIPNWAPLEQIPPLAKDNPWARAHDLAGKFVFMYAGVLGLKHDPQILFALAESFRQQPDVRVVVVSQGPYADDLQAQSRDRQLPNLVLLPCQPVADFPEMLASADVLVTILRAEAGVYSVPSKIYSYMCAQRPQLLAVSGRNQAAKLAVNHQFGLLSDPGDIPALVTNARALYQNHYNNNQMARNARVYAEEHFNMEKIMRQFDGVMARVLLGGR